MGLTPRFFCKRDYIHAIFCHRGVNNVEKPEYFPNSPYVVDNVGGFREELDVLLSISKTRNYGKGEIVYLQGERSRFFYFVKAGKIKVSIFRADGSEKILAIQEHNTFFGESAAFDRYPYFATATALEPSQLQVIEINDAEGLIRKHPQVSFLIITAIIRKLRLLGLQVEDLSFLDAQKRTANILLKLGVEVGQNTIDGLMIRKKVTHEDIANLTGLSRVTVTNVLNHLQRLHIIKKGRLTITITDKGRLESFLDEV